MNRIPKTGDKISYQGREGKIELFSLGWITFREKFARKIETIESEDKDIIYLEKDKLTSSEKNDFVITCVDGDLQNYIFKNLQIGILNKLTEAYSNLDFWRWYRPYKVKSLAWWFNGGKEELDRQYKLFSFEIPSQKPNMQIGKDKIGDDAVIQKSQKTFLDI